MIDLVLVFFCGLVIGLAIGVYAKKREINAVIEMLDTVKDNEHVRAHLKKWFDEEEERKKKLKNIYEYLFGKEGEEE